MTEDPKIKKAPRFLKKRKILTAESLDDAVRGSDTYAKSKVLFGNLALRYVHCLTLQGQTLNQHKFVAYCRMEETTCY